MIVVGSENVGVAIQRIDLDGFDPTEATLLERKSLLARIMSRLPARSRCAMASTAKRTVR
jgi:hypothetical protein